ncbi:MAG: hypothetical protein CMM44_02725 [Rhodospirillaceae bacterium]|nr:hypothetical protein [Rhodospirillaceae bacterium]
MNVFKKKHPSINELVIIREATSNDAEILVNFIHSLNSLNKIKRSNMTCKILLKDAFGPNPAFHILLAEISNVPAGYALYWLGYDTNKASHGVYLSDLYVEQKFRRKGAGKALMQAVALSSYKNGGQWMFWSVQKHNKNARKFYQKIAPELNNVIMCATSHDNFEKLALSYQCK